MLYGFNKRTWWRPGNSIHALGWKPIVAERPFTVTPSFTFIAMEEWERASKPDYHFANEASFNYIQLDPLFYNQI